MKIICSNCGKPVSKVKIPDNTIIRAYIECPECAEKRNNPEKPPRIVFTGTFSVKKVAAILKRYKLSSQTEGEAIMNIIEIAEKEDGSP